MDDIIRFQLDLEHQLKTPLRHAVSLARRALARQDLSTEARSDLVRIRSLCAKAAQVLRSMSVLAREANSQERMTLTEITGSDLARTIREAVEDYRELTEPSRRIVFEIETQTFTNSMILLKVDLELIDIVVRNLLDNAMKYSYADTVIRISGKESRSGFTVEVANKGIRILDTDLARIFDRGWRGEMASVSTGEGSGIGLFVAASIMSAHHGNISITPTTPQGITSVRISIPFAKEPA